MTTLPVFDRTGAEVGSYEIDPASLAPRINKQLLHDVVVMYQANQRQGSAKTKSRGEVPGSTKKMYRQKGTGQCACWFAAVEYSPWWRACVCQASA